MAPAAGEALAAVAGGTVLPAWLRNLFTKWLRTTALGKVAFGILGIGVLTYLLIGIFRSGQAAVVAIAFGIIGLVLFMVVDWIRSPGERTRGPVREYSALTLLVVIVLASILVVAMGLVALATDGARFPTMFRLMGLEQVVPPASGQITPVPGRR